MAMPNVLRTYESLRRFMEQQSSGGACLAPNGLPAYNSGDDGNPQSGLLGRLQELDATHSAYQSSVSSDDHAQAVPADPDIRQLTRRPAALGDQAVSTFPSGSGASTVLPNIATVDGENAPTPDLPPLAEPVFNVLSAIFGHAMSRRSWAKQRKKLAESDPERLAQIEARARARGKFTPSDPGNDCTKRHEEEDDECNERWDDYTNWDYLQACKAQATKRLAYCLNPKGKEPRKWRPGTDSNPGDEEEGNYTPPEWRPNPYSK